MFNSFRTSVGVAAEKRASLVYGAIHLFFFTMRHKLNTHKYEYKRKALIPFFSVFKNLLLLVSE